MPTMDYDQCRERDCREETWIEEVEPKKHSQCREHKTIERHRNAAKTAENEAKGLDAQREITGKTTERYKQRYIQAARLSPHKFLTRWIDAACARFYNEGNNTGGTNDHDDGTNRNA